MAAPQRCVFSFSCITAFVNPLNILNPDTFHPNLTFFCNPFNFITDRNRFNILTDLDHFKFAYFVQVSTISRCLPSLLLRVQLTSVLIGHTSLKSVTGACFFCLANNTITRPRPASVCMFSISTHLRCHALLFCFSH